MIFHVRGTEVFRGSISIAQMWKVSLLYYKRFPPCIGLRMTLMNIVAVTWYN